MFQSFVKMRNFEGGNILFPIFREPKRNLARIWRKHRSGRYKICRRVWKFEGMWWILRMSATKSCRDGCVELFMYDACRKQSWRILKIFRRGECVYNLPFQNFEMTCWTEEKADVKAEATFSMKARKERNRHTREGGCKEIKVKGMSFELYQEGRETNATKCKIE